MNIQTVTVIGANGTMGKNVSGIFASFGNAKVYMVCRTIEAAQKARELAKMTVKAEVIEQNLIPKTYDDLEACIKESDLVFESVMENIEIKKEIYQKLVPFLKPNLIIGSGTSGFSINELSQSFPAAYRPNYMGIHMFNPPYNMTLCELISSDTTDRTLLSEISDYLKKTLLRCVVQVKDAPAFMGNRIGFQFINEALLYAEKYADNGGIDYIDSILGPFTGRNMAPLATSDFVGLDVHKAIVDNIYANTNDYAHETFVMPAFAEKLIAEKKLGRKTGCGLYQMTVNSDGKKTVMVYDIKSGKYRPKEKRVFPFSAGMIAEFKNGNYAQGFACLTDNHSLEAKICLGFLLKYVFYSITMTKQIGENMYAADDVMANGFGWVPPLAIIDALGGTDTVRHLAKNTLEAEELAVIDIDEVLKDIPQSKYDYRSFFKARG